MAEFLVYNKEHWMDKLTQAEVDTYAAAQPDFQAQYDSRYRKGDIVEVREDGYWTDGKRAGFGSHAFALIIVPNLSLEEAQKYTDADFDETDIDDPIRLKRRKHQVDMTKVSLDTDSKASLSGITDTKLVDKTKIAVIE